MRYTSSLLHHPRRQEVITQNSVQQLVKLDISDCPRIIGDIQLSVSVPQDWFTSPFAVLLPDLERIAVVQGGLEQNHLNIYAWEDFRLLESIVIPPLSSPDGEGEFLSQNEQNPEITQLNVTACGTYLYLVGENGQVCLYHLSQHRWLQLTVVSFVCSHKVIFDRTLRLMVVEAAETDLSYSVYRIDDLEQNQLTLIGTFMEVSGCHRGELRLHPWTNAIVWTGYHCRIKYHTFQAEQLAVAPEVDYNFSSCIPYFEQQWGINFPYIQHSQSQGLWQSCLAFPDADTLLFGAGFAIVLIHVTDGRIIAEYQTQSIVHAIEYDADRLQVIAITDTGLIVVPISDFDPTAAYLNSLTLPPAAQVYPAAP
jgi:hypothetical protein